jgi:hypothetical protein
MPRQFAAYRVILHLSSRARYGAANRVTLYVNLLWLKFTFFSKIGFKTCSADHGEPRCDHREDWHTAVL